MKGIQFLSAASDSSLLVGTSRHLYSISRDMKRPFNELISGYSVLDVTETLFFYWIATGHNGLLRLSKETHQLKEFNTSDYPEFKDDFVTCVHVDKNGNIWAGTRYQGLYLISKQNSRFYHYHPGKPRGLTQSNVTGMLGLEGGRILLMNPSQIWVWTKNADAVQSVQCPESEGVCYSSLWKEDDLIYIGSNQGLFRLSEQKKLEPINKTKVLDVVSFWRRQNGIWIIITNDNAFIQADADFNVISRIVPGKMRSDGVPPGQIMDVLETHDGKIYLATENGLVVFNESFLSFSIVQDQSDQYLSPKNINCLFEDESGKIWAGTQNDGLFSFCPDGQSFKRYDASQGLTATSVYSIQADEQQRLWMGTDQGLFRFNTNHNRFTRFTASDGVQDNRFLPRSASRLETGELLFGGVNGYNLFHPRLFEVNVRQSSIFLSELQINNESVTGDLSNLVFNHDQNDVSLEFALLNYAHAGRNTYAIKVDGLTEEWVDLGTRNTVFYNNLTPGRYMFHIKGWSKDGVEGKPVQLSITILSPWWKTLSAYAVYFISFILVTGLLIRFFLQRIHLRNRLQLETMRRQQSEEMIDFKLQFFTNVSHEIRTPLTLISGPLQRLADQEQLHSEKGRQIQIIRQNTNRLLRLVEQLLDFRKL
ncbi:MAG: hypothetical protein JEZ14_24910 [Marinilabiliaceae bacterium]|nr:hypothetical protein [Marinilabiliaceae bacterium]